MGRPKKTQIVATGETQPKSFAILKGGEPLSVMTEAFGSNETLTRTNRAANIERLDKYKNIADGVLPLKYSNGASGSLMDIRESVLLTQKAFFNIPIIYNIINLMTEFSIGNIYFQGGNQTSRDFFTALFNKINLVGLQDRFYREIFRSGNVFISRFDGKLQDDDVRKIIKNFGLESKAYKELDVPKMMIPARYVVLNPADVLYGGSLSFYTGIYFKRLSDYELLRLRNPKTDEDKEVLDSLPPDIRKQIQQRNVSIVNLPLNPLQVIFVANKRQDYEPFACPPLFPLLESLNAKIELQRLDMAIARVAQQVLLLVTMGAEPDKGGINQANLVAMQKLFQNESVSRVLVADYTTKVEWKIPDIGSILGPEKYQQINEDINMGLNNILVGGEKFANQGAKVEVFLARLEYSRSLFLNDFLIPEIRRISKSLGFKSYPTPYYDDITLKNDNLRERVYLRLAEIGILTPKDVVTAIQSNRLPDAETMKQNQEEFKLARDKGLYQPLIGAKPSEDSAPAGKTGRPINESKGVPQSSKQITPIGQGKPKTAKAEELYSTKKLIEVMKEATALQIDVSTLLRLHFKKKKLNEQQVAVAADITKIIISNEDRENWKSKAGDYVKSPIDTNPERVREIEAIAATYGTDTYLASLMYFSKKDPEQEDTIEN